jgi:hypothetical protein
MGAKVSKMLQYGIKGVIQSKKTFDICYQTRRKPLRHQQN